MPVPSMNKATVSRDKNAPKVKLNLGEHVCRVIDVRYKETRNKGTAFYLDFEVVSGPTTPGFREALQYYPDNVQVNSSSLTRDELVEREIGKIQIAIAAAGGWEKEARFNVTDEYAARATALEARKTNPNATSPLAGQLIVIECKPTTTGKCFYEPRPFKGEQAPLVAAPAVAPKPTFPPEGWLVHPDNDDYLWNPSTGATAVVAEVRAQLGL